MSRLQDGIFALTGKKPTAPEIQKLMNIASAMDIKHDDPLIMLFIALDHQLGLFNEAPERIKAAVNQTASDAATNAQAAINNAVAKMVPGVQSAVEKAARDSIVSVQMGSSMLTIFAGFVVLGTMFMLGLIYGSGVQNAMDLKHISIVQVWTHINHGIFAGLTIIGSSILAILYLEDENRRIIRNIALFTSITLFTTLYYNVFIISMSTAKG